MITQHDLEKHDPHKMHKFYDLWPQIARESYESEFEDVCYDKINHIVFAGMGGSGAIGDLFSSILSKSKIHVTLVKGYLLPRTVDKNTLVITTSISGNSGESLAVLESAKNLDCSLIAFSSGGKMMELCKKNNIEYRKIDYIHSPRSSLAKYVYSMLKVLSPVLPITKNEITESINQLGIIKKNISSDNLSDSNDAINLASWISGIPLIYYPYGLQSAAIRFKSSLQENAKLHVMIEDVIEASHNNIVSWERPSTVQPILIQGKDDYIKTKERWDILKQYLKENKIDYRQVTSVSGSILSKIVTLYYLLDYCSIYKAVINQTDPTPVRSIDYIKSKLR